MSKTAKIFCNNSLLNSFYDILDDVKNVKNDFFTNTIIIVPDKFTLNAERMFFEYLDVQSSFNVEIMSLTRLVKKTCQNITRQFEVLNQNTATLIITKILLDNYEKLGLIKNTLSPTLAKEFYETIMQFKSSGILPDEISTKSDNINFKLKLEDIKFVYQEYQNYIKEQSLDSADLLDIFSSQLKNDEKLQKTNIYVAMFENFSFKQLEAITSLALSCKNFTIGLSCTTHQNNKNVYINETLHQVMQSLDNSNIAYQISNKTRKLSENLDFLAKNLYAFAVNEKCVNKNIELVEASNEKDEVDFVARKIKELVTKNQAKFSDFNIACTNFELFKPVIKKIFDYYSIPYYIDEQVILSEHFYGRFILNILRLIESNFDRVYLFEYLTSPFAMTNHDELNDFENYVLEHGINYQSFFKPFKDKKIEILRQKYVFNIKNLVERLNKSITVDDYINALEEFLNAHNTEDILQNISVDARFDAGFRKQTEQVADKTNGAFEVLSRMLGSCECKFDYFCVLLQNLFESVSIKTVPLGVNKVYVGDEENSTFYPNKFLFLVGAVDGSLPAYKNDCGLVSDAEIDLLSSKNILSPSIRFTNKVTRYKLFELIVSCKQKVFVSFANLCFGQVSKPSELIEELRKILKNSDNSPINTYKIANEMQILNLQQAKAEDYIFAFGSRKHCQEVLSKIDNFDVIMSSAKNVLDKTKFDFADSHQILQDAKKLFFPYGKTSVSQIEKYFNCPYQHFATYGLRLKERKVYGIKSVDVGNFLHRVAEKFVNYLIENDFKYNKEKVKKIVLSVVDEQFAELDSTERLKADNLVKEAYSLCDKIFEQVSNSNFKPIFAEKKFIDENYSKNVVVSGKIDRIDQFDNMFLIFDYKTGSKTDFSFQDVYYGNKIQIVLYLDILESVLNLISAGAFYVPIKNKFIMEEKVDRASGIFLDSADLIKNIDKNIDENAPKSKIFKIDFGKNGVLSAYSQKLALSPVEFLAVKQYVKALFENAVEEICSGYIEPKPTKNACNNCPYSVMCAFSKKDSGFRVNEQDISKQSFVKTEEKL